ncbi:MAG: tRNA 2-thiouridine(34) synthase MnmA, partial [Candidatus Margulisiibacteriota bacterium]
MSKGKVIVGLSGGVDSAVAALLLKDQGYEVTGVHMSVWDPTSTVPARASTVPKRDACYCPGDTSDRDEAQLLAQKIGIPFQVLDVSAEYSRAVLDYFSEEYGEGRTPNPCVACNQKIKFGALLDKVTASGIAFDFFATGHYVKKHYLEKEKRHTLAMARDTSKDQTYFLYRLQ